MKKIFKKFKFLFCIFTGIIIGLVFKGKSVILKPLGSVFVNMIFVIVVPLIFLSVTSSISKMDNRKRLKNILIKAFLIFFITLFVTGVFTVIFSQIFNPYKGLDIGFENVELEEINLADKIVSMISVSDFSELFSKSNILSLIIFSIIVGISIGFISEKEKVSRVLDIGNEIITKYLEIIMYYAPVGITAYLASLIGEYGSTFLQEYARIVIMYLIFGIFNILVFHTLYLFIAGGKKIVYSYYKNIAKLIITAVSTQSSVVTMPVNINTLKNMGVSDEVISICTPIATLINMQGNVIQNILKIFLLYGLFALQIGDFGNIIFFILISIFAGMITAGIPGGGVISNTILVSVLNLPASALPILVTIEWLLDAPATAFNILSDTSTIPLIDKIVFKEREKNERIRKKV